MCFFLSAIEITFDLPLVKLHVIARHVIILLKQWFPLRKHAVLVIFPSTSHRFCRGPCNLAAAAGRTSAVGRCGASFFTSSCR